MISNITYKTTAYIQVSMHEQLQAFAQTNPYASVPIAVFVCVADVTAETIKCPITAAESLAFSVINVAGSSCLKECSLLDSYQNIKKAGMMLCATPVMLTALPYNLLQRFLVNLSDPEKAQSCNKKANEQAKFPIIDYDSHNCKIAQKVVEHSDLATAEEAVINTGSVSQGLFKVSQSAIENSSPVAKIGESILTTSVAPPLDNKLSTRTYLSYTKNLYLDFTEKADEITIPI